MIFIWRAVHQDFHRINMELEQQLEAILFYKGEPMKVKLLAKMFNAPQEAIVQALTDLQTRLAETNRGIRLVIKDEEVQLGTAPEMSETIEAVRKEEITRDIGKAGLETLSIILYKGPVSRAEIDFIRGVNSSFILRNLMVRAMIERVSNPNDSRSFLYKPTFELLQFLGVTKVEELPEYEKVIADLQAFVETENQEEEEEEKSVSNPFDQEEA